MSTELPAKTAYPLQFAAAEASACLRQTSILANAPWLRDDLVRRCQRIVDSNAGVRSKLPRLRELADEISAAIETNALCLRGCSHCCRMMVSMAEAEAENISAAIGRPLIGHGVPAAEANRRKGEWAIRYWGVPCPFLQNDECSIHAHRPIACRLHFSLADAPFFCQTDLKPDESAVPNIQMPPFWRAYATITGRGNHGDIRDFFATSSPTA